MPSAPTITFDVKPSRLLAGAVWVMALAACVAVLVSGLPLLARLVLCAVAVAYAAFSVRKLKRQPLRAVGGHGDDTWTLYLAGGREATGQLLGGRVVGPLIVLRLAWPGGGRSALTLLPDSIDTDTRRRLRVRLSTFSDTH